MSAGASVAAVIVAAGKGARLPGSLPKQWQPLAGIPLIVHSLRFFDSLDCVNQIIFVLDDATLEMPDRLAHLRSACGKVLRCVAGGASRQESALRGLETVEAETEIVMVHDAARPFPPRDAVMDGLQKARELGGAILAAPVVETIKEVDGDGRVVKTFDRSKLWAVQTPQIFQYGPLLEAYRSAEDRLEIFTDDASIFEEAGGHVRIIPAGDRNIKVTLPKDFALAETILREIKK
ncbi:MAG: 2-C-methyl-D-erythritol 4-phosphate cytidylyltransferase [Candidatus Sumerlaeia bacterium]